MVSHRLDDPAGKQQIRKIRLKLQDKLRALELLGKHLGLFDEAQTNPVDTLAMAVRQIAAKGSAAPIATRG